MSQRQRIIFTKAAEKWSAGILYFQKKSRIALSGIYCFGFATGFILLFFMQSKILNLK